MSLTAAQPLLADVAGVDDADEGGPTRSVRFDAELGLDKRMESMDVPLVHRTGSLVDAASRRAHTGSDSSAPTRVLESGPALRVRVFGEFLGTFLLVGMGLAVSASANVAGLQKGVWQSAAAWQLAVALAIYVAGPLSGAHLNPAVTAAFALVRRREFPLRLVVPYVGAQLAGAFRGALFAWALYEPMTTWRLGQLGLGAGDAGSELVADAFLNFFPAPGLVSDPAALAAVNSLVSPARAWAVEALAVGALLLFVAALTDPDNEAAVSSFAREGLDADAAAPDLPGAEGPDAVESDSVNGNSAGGAGAVSGGAGSGSSSSGAAAGPLARRRASSLRSVGGVVTVRRPLKPLVPLLVGGAVALLISAVAPLTGAGMNPARDAGPRLLLWMAGWGRIAFPGARDLDVLVYWTAPLVGGPLGMWLYDALLAGVVRGLGDKGRRA
jgi:glycerol uptake facilitator-like aquaporin